MQKDKDIQVKTLKFNLQTKEFIESKPKELFLKGPIPMTWLSQAAKLPGKVMNLSIAIWWLHGMKKAPAFKLTSKSFRLLNISRDAVSDGLKRLEGLGLITIIKRSGKTPLITIIESKNTEK
jgi:hypothetical protein